MRILWCAVLAALLVCAATAGTGRVIVVTAQTPPPPSPAAGEPPRPPFPALAPPAIRPGEPQRQVFTLSQLGTGGDLTLQGVNPSATVYVPVADEWDVKDARLVIRLAHSAALLGESTLTLRIENVPVASVRLTPENAKEAVWDVPIPPELIKGDLLTVTFTGYLRTSANACADLEDVANWVTVREGSTVEVTAGLRAFEPNLGRFPYPFFRSRAIGKTGALLVVPDDAAGEDWAALMPLAATFGQRASFRDYTLYAIHERDLTPTLGQGYDLIVAGRSEQLRWLREQGSTLPLRLEAGQRVLTPAGTPVPDTTGVIIETVSPWNPARGVLTITGQTSDALRRAVSALVQPAFPNLARGPYALVGEPPQGRLAPPSPDFNALSLQSLGYADRIVQGIGRQTIDVTFETPVEQQVKDAQLTLNFSHSSFVSTDRSYINVVLNDVPIKGAFLSSENEERATLKVTLPGRQFRPGRNTLRFLMELHLVRNEDCSRKYLDQAWGVVHQDTWLNVQFGEKAPSARADLAGFPAPFGEGTLLVLPSQPRQNELAGAFLLMVQLGRMLGDRSSALTAVTADQVDRSSLVARHVILIGQTENNAWLAETAGQFPYRVSEGVATLQGQGASLRVEGTQAVGLLELFPSPWNSGRTALALTGTGDEGIGWAALLLAEPDRRATIRGNVAVIDATGAVTTLDTRGGSAAAPGPTHKTRETPRWAGILIALFLSALVAVLGIVLVRRVLRQRRERRNAVPGQIERTPAETEDQPPPNGP